MKNKMLAIAAAGLMSVSAISSAGINPYNIGSADYPDFQLLNADPVGSVAYFGWNIANDEFSLFWTPASVDPSATVDPSAYIGNNGAVDFLMGYDSLTTTLSNSSGEETNFALFVNYVASDSSNVLEQSAFTTLADNQAGTFSYDFVTDATTWNSVASFGIVVQAITDDNLTHVEVPEPSSIATLGAGLLALGFVARRKKIAQK